MVKKNVSYALGDKYWTKPLSKAYFHLLWFTNVFEQIKLNVYFHLVRICMYVVIAFIFVQKNINLYRRGDV